MEMCSLCVVLLVSCASIVSMQLVAASTDVEAQALLGFFQGIKRDGNGCVATTWKSGLQASGGCPSSFCGVSCSHDGMNVVGLNLSGHGIEGVIVPRTLSTLKSLIFLDLSNNFFSGKLPDDLGDLSHLEKLDLSHNALSGSIPGTFTGLESLVALYLADNQLSGSIPATLGTLSHLTSLNLSHNFLTESIPEELAQLASLKTFDLHSNQLSGEIHPAFLALSSLTIVDLSSNKLSGFIPWQPNDTLPLLRTLQYVNLSHNQLTGPLAPERFSSVFAESLKVLDMSFNQLSGNLPNFEFAFALETLRMSHNLFVGAVPSTLLSATTLEELDLSNNSLTGDVTHVLSTSLRVLNLSSNLLTGTIPSKVGSCAVVDLGHNMIQGDLSSLQYWSEMLEILDLSYNNLIGGLVDTDVKFVGLRRLDLSHNSLKGPIPLSYGIFPKLSIVDLSFNQLNGSIPASFFNSSTLSYLFLSNNQLAGSLPLQDTVSFTSVLNYPPSSSSEIPLASGQTSQMIALDLSNNRLDGRIPETISRFQQLEKLDLSNNSFQWEIPNALCNLTMLQSLDLSANELSGPIPDALPNTLLELNLSSNHLSGLIPANLRKFPYSSFYPGNEGLFSPWLNSSSTGGPLSSVARHKRTFGTAVKAGLIGGCTAGLALICIVGLLVYYRCKHESYSRGGEISNNDIVKGHKMWSPCAAYFAFHERADDVPPGMGFSADLLLERPRKVASASTYSGSYKETKSPWRPNLNIGTEDSVKTGGMEMSPSQTRQKFSPGSNNHESSRLAEEFAQSDSPIVLKVRSPDRLAGDLHFLDKSLKFSAEELSRAPAEVLGRSSHGTSYKATLDNGHVLTVKWLREGLAKGKKEFAREAKKFAKVRHPNLIPLRGYYWGPREHEKLILSDFVSTGSLAAHFSDRTGQRYALLSWKQRLVIAVDIARGLLYLHEERHLPHGNLKATNVLIDGPNYSGRLADYCLHQLMTCEGTANQILNAGALGYRAPELATLKKPKPTMKGDVYAFGVILLELLTGKGAGDIISGQSGAVDLTDWVKMLATEIRTADCFDPALVGEGGHDLPRGMDEMLAIALKCISQQAVERPHIRSVYEDLTSIAV